MRRPVAPWAFTPLARAKRADARRPLRYDIVWGSRGRPGPGGPGWPPPYRNPKALTYDVVSYFDGCRSRRVAILAALAAVTISACTASTDADVLNGDAQPTLVDPESASTTALVAPRAPATVAATDPTATASTSTTTTTSTSTTTTTTTVPPAPLDVFDPSCVVRTVTAGSMELLAMELAVAVAPIDLWFENGFVNGTQVGDLVDTCVSNGINDIDGTPRAELNDSTIAGAVAANVEQQQVKLNELFAGLGIGDLVVDGVSGELTGQRLCAARLAFGLTTTIADMSPGTEEQMRLFGATGLPTPTSTATASQRWVLIDRTCQIMFIGAGEQTSFVFPTSTGSEGFETRDQDRAAAFRFNPALDNGGWHNSSEFPVGVDNPRNGNLYKPLYFDLGQAIHGANNVPPTPQSKGCARLRITDQETFIAWLGLDGVETELWRRDEMNVTVNVQGAFVPRELSTAP